MVALLDASSVSEGNEKENPMPGCVTGPHCHWERHQYRDLDLQVGGGRKVEDPDLRNCHGRQRRSKNRMPSSGIF
jgi:hypothetical protein